MQFARTLMSFTTRLLLALTLVVTAALLVFAVAVFGDLPVRIPTHFNAAGIPDGFGPRSRWWFLPAVGLLSTAVTVVIALVAPRRPHLLNVPWKAEILALPPAAQATVVHAAQPALMMLGLLSAVLVFQLQYSTWEVANGRTGFGIDRLLVVVPLVSLLLLPAIMLPVNRELRRQQALLKRQ
jgi:uncharacterized membrane protein